MAVCVYLQSQKGRHKPHQPDHGHQAVTGTQPPVYHPCFTIPNGFTADTAVSKQRYFRISAECLGFVNCDDDLYLSTAIITLV